MEIISTSGKMKGPDKADQMVLVSKAQINRELNIKLSYCLCISEVKNHVFFKLVEDFSSHPLNGC
jgi:hypothetical protein